MAEDEAAIRAQPSYHLDRAKDHIDHSVFNFFGLPAELRNAIYSMLVEDIDVSPSNQSAQATIRNRKIPKCLLLNRQFKEEHEHEVAHHLSLEFKDLCYGSFRTDIPAHVRGTISRATFRLVFSGNYTSSAYGMDTIVSEANYHGRMFKRDLLPMRLTSPHILHVEAYPLCLQSSGIKPCEFGRELITELRKHIEFERRVEVAIFPVRGCRDERMFPDYEAGLHAQETWVGERGSDDEWKLVSSSVEP